MPEGSPLGSRHAVLATAKSLYASVVDDEDLDLIDSGHVARDAAQDGRKHLLLVQAGIWTISFTGASLLVGTRQSARYPLERKDFGLWGKVRRRTTHRSATVGERRRRAGIGQGHRVPPQLSRKSLVWAPTLRRSVRLFRAFRLEQTRPEVFYGELAQDAVGHIRQYTDLRGIRMLDVGGGPGYFRGAFQDAGATYFALDADVGELSGLGDISSRTVVGSGLQLPFADDTFDLCYSSNVLEHVSDPWLMADEMVRVTKRGGITFLSYTVWYGPWGGHETAPWHFLGGHRARQRYLRRHGHEPKNRFGESLFPVTVGAALAWSRRQTQAEVLDVIPRYNPRFAYWLSRIPIVRELVTWNLVIVLQRR